MAGGCCRRSCGPWLRHSAFPVVDDGQTVGLVTVRRVKKIPVDERDGNPTARPAI
jgi:hypothetical protein